MELQQLRRKCTALEAVQASAAAQTQSLQAACLALRDELARERNSSAALTALHDERERYGVALAQCPPHPISRS